MPKRSHAVPRQPVHDEQAAGGRQHAHRPDERHPERPRPIGLLVAQHEHADADQHEGEQRADVRQVVGFRRVADQRPQRDEHAR